MSLSDPGESHIPRRPAILIFFKVPVPGKVKTRLQPHFSPDFSAALAEALLLEMLWTVRETVCVSQRGQPRLILFSDTELPHALRTVIQQSLQPYLFEVRLQGSGDLGERMTRAFAYVFDSGSDAGVIYGTDSPGLPKGVIAGSLEGLMGAEPAITLGPAEDGGFYCLGMNRFFPELFYRVPYSTSKAYTETLKRAIPLAARLLILQRWIDIDTPEDVHVLKERIPLRPESLIYDVLRTQDALRYPYSG